MNDEVGFLGQAVDLVDSRLQCGGDIGIRRLVEAHMAVADLDEVEFSLRGILLVLAEGLRREDSAAHGPEDAGSRPGHALQKAAAVNAVVVVVVSNQVRHVSPRKDVYGLLFAYPDSNARRFIPSRFLGNIHPDPMVYIGRRLESDPAL